MMATFDCANGLEVCGRGFVNTLAERFSGAAVEFLQNAVSGIED